MAVHRPRVRQAGCRRRSAAGVLLSPAPQRKNRNAASRISPYLFRIATNLLHDRWRRGDDLTFEAPDKRAVEMYPERELDITRMLHRLKPRSRQLLWLAYVEELTHREIAAITGLNVLSIRILLLRARREARALLTSEAEEHV